MCGCDHVKFHPPLYIALHTPLFYTTLGLSQLCWHNFRIIGTSLGGFSIKNNARIIGRILAQLGGGACHLVCVS